jgi:hypothetical protein
MFGKKLTSLLIAAAVLALSGLAATTASAETFKLTSTACQGGTTIAICYQGTNPAGKVGTWELEGDQSITALAGTGRLIEPSLESLTIECNGANSGGEPVILQHSPLGNGLTTIEGGDLIFLGCKITAPASPAERCEIPSTLGTVNLLGELESETDVVLTPESGTTFITFPFKNKSTLTCPAAFVGELKIKGSQLINILNPSVPEATKLGEVASLSGLTFGESNPAELISPEIEIEFTGLAPDLVIISKIS